MNKTMVSYRSLGQSGWRIEYNDTVIYMDPYLSNFIVPTRSMGTMSGASLFTDL